MSVSVQTANNSYLQRQIETPLSKGVRTTTTSHNDRIMHKNLLLCNLCSWPVSYTDYSDSLNMIDEYAAVTCPVCKDGRIKSSINDDFVSLYYDTMRF